MSRSETLCESCIASVDGVADVLAPVAIILAVYSSHRKARELDAGEGV